MSKKIKNFILLSIVPIFSLINSILQAQYGYDGFHWGLVLYTADSLNLGLLPYKEVFIHYGFLTSKINAIILKIFSNNFLYLFALSSVVYAFSIYIQSLLVLRLTNIYYAIIAGLIIFFLHPYAIYPWHSYYLFFLINIFLLFRFSENILLRNISYFILSLSILFSESFFLASILILIFDLIIIYLSSQNRNFFLIGIFAKRISIYLIPIIIFLFYLYLNNIFSDWQKYNQMGNIFLELLNTSLFELVLIFPKKLFLYSLKYIFITPNWLIYLILIIFNIFYLLNFLRQNYKKKNYFKNINQDEIFIALVSFCSLVLLYQALHSFVIFKFSCGLILGLIVLIYYLSKLKNNENKIILICILFLYSLNAFSLFKTENNELYVYKFKKEEYIKNDYFDYFKSHKWDEKTWSHLIDLDTKLSKIFAECNIKNGTNLSGDGIISVLMRKKINIEQILPWYDLKQNGWQNKYFSTMWRYFDTQTLKFLNKKINNEDIVIYTDKENYPNIFLNNEFLKIEQNMKAIDLPYSYENKNKVLIIPNNCKI